MLIGYIPDRAYYFTVFSTIEIGLNPQAPPASYVTPINFCPADNETLPCPAPIRRHGPVAALAQGDLAACPADRRRRASRSARTCCSSAAATAPRRAPTSRSPRSSRRSTFDVWKPGPALPAPRANAATIFAGGSIYVIGGTGADGKPTTTVWSLTPDPNTGAFKEWKVDDTLTLKDARSNASVVAASDGIVVAGGIGASGPLTSVSSRTSTRRVPSPRGSIRRRCRKAGATPAPR